MNAVEQAKAKMIVEGRITGKLMRREEGQSREGDEYLLGTIANFWQQGMNRRRREEKLVWRENTKDIVTSADSHCRFVGIVVRALYVNRV